MLDPILLRLFSSTRLEMSLACKGTPEQGVLDKHTVKPTTPALATA